MRYFIRSVKFLAALIVIYLLAVWIMTEAGVSMHSMRETVLVLFRTRSGLLLVAAIVVWAAVYPRVNFVSRRVEGDIAADREQIVNAFAASGYVLKGEDGECMRFRASGIFRKLRFLFEDEIKVSQYGQWIELEGIRRGVAEVRMRLDIYLRNKYKDNDEGKE